MFFHSTPGISALQILIQPFYFHPSYPISETGIKLPFPTQRMCGLASEAENPLKMRSAHHYYPTPAFQLQPLVLLPLEAVKHNIPLHASQRLNMSNMTGLNIITCLLIHFIEPTDAVSLLSAKKEHRILPVLGMFICRVHGTALLSCCLHHIRPMEFLLDL